MPVVNVTLLKGYDLRTREALGQALTGAIAGVIAAPPEAIVVCFQELDEGNYYRGGQPRVGGKAQPSAADRVRAFLAAMEARDLETARTFLAPDFTMTFPSGKTMTQLEELVAFSKNRYKFVRKTFEAIDTSWQGERAVVHCHGTLAGEGLDGQVFDGVRFIDRFEVKSGLLCRQQVWNDLALVLGTPK
jgi:phenylpyruvate tautomerase PptA (4-oxalocrotonate tautomerase family)/ketosteroid isomerase-like protein